MSCYIRADGRPGCCECGCDLRGVPARGRCPECGCPYSTALIHDDQSRRRWGCARVRRQSLAADKEAGLIAKFWAIVVWMVGASGITIGFALAGLHALDPSAF